MRWSASSHGHHRLLDSMKTFTDTNPARGSGGSVRQTFPHSDWVP